MFLQFFERHNCYVVEELFKDYQICFASKVDKCNVEVIKTIIGRWTPEYKQTEFQA
jgi:hypothetical protein